MEDVFQGIRSFLLAVIRELQNEPSEDTIERASVQLDQMCTHVVRVAGVGGMGDDALVHKRSSCFVYDLHVEFPNCGYRRLEGHLLARGIKVPQLRIRDALRRVDPTGVASRWLCVTPRRTYSVRGPLALWHIDGNHFFSA